MFGEKIELKTPDQIALMREAGLVVASTLALLREHAVAGVTTAELDQLARDNLARHGAESNFLDYAADEHGLGGFQGVVCTSVNDEVVHGVPGPRVLHDGDLVSIDCGAIVEGWHGDAAITVAVGDPAPEHAELMRVTEGALWAGIAAARLGGKVSDISAAIEDHVTAAGPYGLADGLTGHGIGSDMHQPPWVPNVRPPRGVLGGRSPKLVEGLVLAVEPMLTLGTSDNRTLADGWTIETTDGSWAAHFEHTFTLTPRGAWVLTAEDGGRERLEEIGVPYGGP